MYKVLVVDDEVYIRKGIINAIQWSSLDLELVGEAEDGIEAIEKAEILKPEIIIMDMRMPGMDGIGLIQALKSRLPSIKLIVISAYSDFEYTREAIVNKVFDYLLKPVKKDQLNDVLSNCITEINDEKQKNERKKLLNETNIETIVKSFIFDEANGLQDIEKTFALINDRLHFPGILCVVSKIDNIGLAKAIFKESDILTIVKDYVEYALKQIVGDNQIVLINRVDYEVIALFHLSSSENDKIKSTLQNIIKSIYTLKGFSISMGFSDVVKSPNELCSNYKQAVRIVKTKELSLQGKVLSKSDIENANNLGNGFASYNSKLLVSSIKVGDREKSLSIFKKLLSEFLIRKFTVYLLHKNMIILLGDIEKELNVLNTTIDIECGKSSIAYVKDIMGTFGTCEIEDLFETIIYKLCDFFASKCKKGSKKIVDEIIKSMYNEYSDQISIFGYAKQYYINPDYLGRVFKNVTGKSFVDFLTGIRINKAKELIAKDICTHYYEVAACIGYDDYSYFSKVFKIVTGLTPSEYKDKCLSEENLQQEV